MQVRNTFREVASHNVVAKLEGSDPKLKDEYVIYTAHWDHEGVDPDESHGSLHDRIYHGALDNASGTAALLELANAYMHLGERPKRSILFISTTAEEQGLLGAKYYAAKPLYPLSKTLADINIDVINPWGRTRDVAVTGYGVSSLDAEMGRLAAMQGRTLKPDPRPDRGGFYRSDQFEFAKKGVPVMNGNSGNDYLDKPPGYGEQMANDYTTHNYHKPSDVIQANWDMSGAVEDGKLLFMLGYETAQSPAWPQWNAGAEFKPLRDAMMTH
jgi:Zn-dependent M28 family amino/carboxypeptidase